MDTGKVKHFTPGRIRASRMGAPDYKNGTPQHGRDDFMNSTGGKPTKLHSKQQPYYPRVESVERDDSLKSIEDADYNQILPAVKLRSKKKKQNKSPSDHSPGENSSQAGLRNRDHSMSRISAFGKDPKLRATLDQGLNWKPTSVKVPKK